MRVGMWRGCHERLSPQAAAEMAELESAAAKADPHTKRVRPSLNIARSRKKPIDQTGAAHLGPLTSKRGEYTPLDSRSEKSDDSSIQKTSHVLCSACRRSSAFLELRDTTQQSIVLSIVKLHLTETNCALAYSGPCPFSTLPSWSHFYSPLIEKQLVPVNRQGKYA